MKSITIHGMDSALAERLQREALESGLSLNKAIKKLLAAALGMAPSGTTDRRRDFEGLCGVWTKQEAKDFQKAIQECERVDGEDWA